MRSLNRIPRILKLIEEIWTECPDLRLCQLIGNCFQYTDSYFIEDDDLEEQLRKTYYSLLNKDG